MAEIFGRRLGLIFNEATGSPSMSGPSRAQIYVQTFTTGQPEGFSKPLNFLTPMEYGPDAFDEHADALIENIKALKREARAEFAKARARGH